ncbi:MAG: hypothetical protein KDD50_03875 [Bdellovibrionales bacterium]|nr:hypothetical protein [Bdellovibrionales bacterium]
MAGLNFAKLIPMRTFRHILFLIILTHFLPVMAQTKQKILSEFEKLKSQTHKEIIQTEKDLKDTIQAGHQAFLINPKSALKTTSLDYKMLQLIEKRKELILRQEFYNQLSLKFHQHYQETNISEFLSKSLQELAYQEAISPQPNPQKWRFLSYLNQVIQSLPDIDNNLIEFVAQYTNTSSISEPISPNEFLASHNYTNGIISQRARQIKPSNVGDSIDEKLNFLDRQEYEKRQLSPPKLLPPQITNSPKS